jgi:adenosylhomocysteine nucleosidase
MIHLVVALPQEAKPIVDFFRLKQVLTVSSFPLYEGDGKRLIISGIGKLKAAEATMFLAGFSKGERDMVWLNVGIGGHRSIRVGEGVLANKVSDSETKYSWYPPIFLDDPLKQHAVLTVPSPEKEYKENAVYDMEASGFLGAAIRFSTIELIHCYKMISDNKAADQKRISKSMVSGLVAGHLTTLQSILKKLETLSKEVRALNASPTEFEKFQAKWHFTVAQERLLKRRLKRLETLRPNTAFLTGPVKQFTNGKEVLQFLEDQLEQTLTPCR